MAYNSSTANIKGCIYRALGYPESQDPNVIQKLKDMGLSSFAVSCLHDKDRFDSDQWDENGNLVHRAGDLKKAHYHYVFKFSGGTTWKTVYERICKPLGLVLSPLPQECLAFSDATALRYFLHLDNPEKFQYGIESLDLCQFFGYNERKLEEIFLSSNARVSYFIECQKLICAYDIIYYNWLCDYLILCQAYDLLEYVTFSGRTAVLEYIKNRCGEIYGEYNLKKFVAERHKFLEDHNITPIESVILDLKEKASQTENQ